MTKVKLKEVTKLDEPEAKQLRDRLEGWRYKRVVTAVDIDPVQDAMRRIDLTVSWGADSSESYTLVYFMRSKEK